MPRKGELSVTKDKQSGKWVVNMSAKVSMTGKRARKKFDTKAEAETHRKSLVATIASPRLQEFDESLLETATYYDDAFQLYGYKNLADACAAWIKELDRRNISQPLGELVKDYKIKRGTEWSAGYLHTYGWAKKQLTPMSEKLVSQLDAHFWQTWLPAWRKKGKYSAKSFNHLRTFLVSIYSMPIAVATFPSNPIKSIPSAKIKRKEITIATNKQTSQILHTALINDPEMVPWFAIAFFAGLRPQSELGRLDWSDINFDEKWIRVGFGNKTDTKRFVDLSDNLIEWLTPFKKTKGSIQQTNHRKRKDALAKGLLDWERDITRHTYGSNLEAQARAEGKDVNSTVLSNMGHTMAQTFEQHYKNTRTAKEAANYWAITPIQMITS
jgi:integrase